MRTGVRRVPTQRLSSATYTLGTREAFRLDALSFTDAWANEGGYVIPTLTARTQDGHVIAEIAASALQIAPDVLTGFSYSGPANLTDDYSALPPDGYTGYLFHDFGAGIVTSHLTGAWTQPPGLRGNFGATWLRAAGASSMGAAIGSATVEGAASITVTLTGAGIAAGHYLGLRWASVDTIGLSGATQPVPTASDSVGGNRLDFDNAVTYGYGMVAAQRADGLWLNSGIEFWRIVNPLPLGATVTFTPSYAPLWLHLDVHDFTGLTVGTPIGPNPGGNAVGIGASSLVSPATTALPVGGAKWLGPVFFNGLYAIDLGGTAEVMMARGGVEIQTPGAFSLAGVTKYVQTPLPELHLSDGDTLTVSSQDTLGERLGDQITDFNIWGVDE